MDILVHSGNDLECPVHSLNLYLLQPHLDSLEFVIAEYSDLVVAPCSDNAAQDILRVECAIVINRLVV